MLNLLRSATDVSGSFYRFTSMDMWLDFLLLAPLLFVAAVNDVKHRRIPNWICVAVALTGILTSGWLRNGTSMSASCYGLLIGFSVPLLAHALKALGAGDVKLLAGIGAWLGPQQTVTLFVWTALIGGAGILIWAIATGSLITLVRNMLIMGMQLAVTRSPRTVGTLAAEQAPAVRITFPVGVAIFLGTVLILLVPQSVRVISW